MVLGRRLTFLLFAVLLMATPGTAEERVLESRISVCVNPATPPLVARSDDDRKKFPSCLEWSSVASTSTVVDVLQFVNCNDPKAPLGRFLTAVLRTWNGQSPASTPVTSTMFGSPKSFQLRALLPGEPRSDSLIVWNGMAALIVGDTNKSDTPFDAKPELSKLRILYPAERNECGALIESDAQTLADDLLRRQIVKNPNDYRLLVARRARLFWNHWIADERGREQPEEVKVGSTYTYRVTFSALDFEAFQRGDQQARIRLSSKEVDNYLLELPRYKISVLPVGEFAEKRTRSATVRVDEKTLKRTLTEDQIKIAASYAELADAHDALYVVPDNAPEAKIFSFPFSVRKPGCLGLAVIVWSDQPRKIISSWIRAFRAVSDEPVAQTDSVPQVPADVPAESDRCGKPVGVSRRVGPASIPWFDTADDPRAAARIAFVDFADYSIGGFQDLRPGHLDEEPLSWVVEQPLRKSLADFGAFVNAQVNRAAFSMAGPSGQLWKVLFRCRDQEDSDCDGIEALRRLRQLAVENPDARVQASFRDIAGNGTYFLPIHLLDQTSEPRTLLGRQLRFVQPFPVPVSAIGRSAGCVREWSGGLIVSDSPALDETWRKEFVPSLATAMHHRLLSSTYTLEALSDYFSNTRLRTSAPEGLLMLAHHGDGDISDTTTRLAFEHIKPEQVKRYFRQGSVTLLVACSVGALGDLEGSGSRFLFSLNGHNVRAAVISPFQVSPPLARSFLDKFKAVVENLEQDTTLFKVLDAVKAKIQDPAEGHPSLGVREAVETFMVVGDGDVTICKKGE